MHYTLALLFMRWAPAVGAPARVGMSRWEV